MPLTWIFVAIFLAGGIASVAYVVWLVHKVSDLLSELKMIGTRASELAELLEKVDLAGATRTTGN